MKDLTEYIDSQLTTWRECKISNLELIYSIEAFNNYVKGLSKGASSTADSAPADSDSQAVESAPTNLKGYFKDLYERCTRLP